MSSTNWLDLLEEAKNNGGPQEYGPIPAGEYKLKVLTAETRQTQQQKTKYTIKAQITEGPHANRLVWDDLIVSPESSKAMGFFFSKMNALGLDQKFFATQPSDDQITGALENREFIGKVIIDNWGGKDRNKIDGYKPVATGGGFIPGAPQASSPAAPVPSQPFQAAPQQPQAQQAPQQSPWDQGGAQQAPQAPQQQPQAPAGPWDQQQPQAPQQNQQPGGAPNFPQPPF